MLHVENNEAFPQVTSVSLFHLASDHDEIVKHNALFNQFLPLGLSINTWTVISIALRGIQFDVINYVSLQLKQEEATVRNEIVDEGTM